MLIRFKVSNFLSFNEPTEFNMLTAPHIRRHAHHVHKLKGAHVLRSAVIYGANGAGKSNLINALDLMRRLVLFGNEDPLLGYPDLQKSESGNGMSEGIPNALTTISAFKLKGSDLNYGLSGFEVEFSNLNSIYRYGFELDPVFEYVKKEYLFQNNEEVFSYENEGFMPRSIAKLGMSKLLEESTAQAMKALSEGFLRRDQLLLGAFVKGDNNRSIALHAVIQWFRYKLKLLDFNSKPSWLWSSLKQDGFDAFAEPLLKNADTGIVGTHRERHTFEEFYGSEAKEKMARVKSIMHATKTDFWIDRDHGMEDVVVRREQDDKLFVYRLTLLHQSAGGEAVEFLKWEESEGTNRYLEYIPMLYNLLKSPGSVWIIDEMDRSMHPSLLKTILHKFSEAKEAAGQLLFTTHDTNLLDQDLFRQDEIWFAEKDQSGATQFYPLSDFDIRNDLDLQKGYLAGRFNAIPFLGNMRDLNWDLHSSSIDGSTNG